MMTHHAPDRDTLRPPARGSSAHVSLAVVSAEAAPHGLAGPTAHAAARREGRDPLESRHASARATPLGSHVTRWIAERTAREA